MDEDIDWALDVTSSACFFTVIFIFPAFLHMITEKMYMFLVLIQYNKQTENDLKQFFQNKEIVSPSTALDTTIAFQVFKYI